MCGQFGWSAGEEIDEVEFLVVGGRQEAGGGSDGDIDGWSGLLLFPVLLRSEVIGDFCWAAEDEQAASDGELVAGFEHSELDRSSVDSCSVGAVEVGEDNSAAIFLDLGVEAADPFVVELDSVVVFSADRDRSFDRLEDFASFESFEDLDRNVSHRLPLRLARIAEKPHRGGRVSSPYQPFGGIVKNGVGGYRRGESVVVWYGGDRISRRQRAFVRAAVRRRFRSLRLRACHRRNQQVVDRIRWSAPIEPDCVWLGVRYTVRGCRLR